jgi:hypothetical protein
LSFRKQQLELVAGFPPSERPAQAPAKNCGASQKPRRGASQNPSAHRAPPESGRQTVPFVTDFDIGDKPDAKIAKMAIFDKLQRWPFLTFLGPKPATAPESWPRIGPGGGEPVQSLRERAGPPFSARAVLSPHPGPRPLPHWQSADSAPPGRPPETPSPQPSAPAATRIDRLAARVQSSRGGGGGGGGRPLPRVSPPSLPRHRHMAAGCSEGGDRRRPSQLRTRNQRKRKRRKAEDPLRKK